MELIERNRLVQENMPIVKRLVNVLISCGQSAAIERDDLMQEGYCELIRTVDAQPRSKFRSIQAAVTLNVWSHLVRFCTREKARGVTMAPPGLTVEDLDAYLVRFEGEDDDAG